MVANMTLKQAEDAHRVYIRNSDVNDEDTPSSIDEHLANDAENVSFQSGKPRIILVSANFSKELTTSVLWLNEIGAEITCVKLQPWKTNDGVFLESSHVIPVPEAKDYMVRMRNREEEAQQLIESTKVERYHGSDFFRETVGRALEDRKPLLNSLLELAEHLEKQGLAELSTTAGSTYTNLHVRVPNENSGFYYVTINKHGDGHLNFASTRLLDSLAPKSKKRLEQILGKQIKDKSQEKDLSKDFIEAMKDAYLEAKESSVD